MESIVIQNYEPENHEDCKRIFASGQIEQIVKAIIIGWQKPSVIGYISFFCIFGLLFSFYYGMLGLLFGVSIHAASVYCMYALYVRETFNGDMKDKELKYWTKSPNKFWVAKSKESGKILGCASYKEISPSTVSLCRVAVDQNFRGLKIGENLLRFGIDLAKETGHDTMYLESSEAQKEGHNLYKKHGFEYLKSVPCLVYGFDLELVSGNRELSFTKRI